MPPAGTPEAFKVLYKELQALGLDTKLYDSDGNEVILKQDLDDDGIPTVTDDQAFTEVNDFEGQEGYGMLDESGEEIAEANQDEEDDLFASMDSFGDDDYYEE